MASTFFKSSALLGGIAAAVVGAGASASIQIKYAGTGYGASGGSGNLININKTNPGQASGAYTYNGFAGQLKFQNQTANAYFGAGQVFSTYCVELGEYTDGGYNPYDVVGLDAVPDNLPAGSDPPPAQGPMGLTKSSLIKYLWAEQKSSLGTNGNLHAAFQLCVWEISHENINTTDLQAAANGLSLTLGTGFNAVWSTNATLTGLANAMLATLKLTNWDNANAADLMGLYNTTLQDQVFEVVPLPAPAVLAGLGLIGVAGLRRRMKKA